MVWLQNILKFKGQYLQQQAGGFKSPLRALLLEIFSQIQFYDSSLARVVSQNQHLMDFMIDQHEQQKIDEEDPQTTAQSNE